AHVAAGRFVHLIADAFAHAGGPRRASLVVVAGVSGYLGLGPLVGLPCLDPVPVHVSGGVRLRDLDLAPRPRRPCTSHAGEQRERAEERSGVDPDRRMLGHVAEPLLVVCGWHNARPGVERDPVRGEVAVRAGHAVPANRAEHDPAIDLLATLEPEAGPRERAGSPRLHARVGLPDEVLVHLDRFLLPQIEGDAPLPPMDVEVHERLAFDDWPRHLAYVVALRRLDLDDV